MVCNGLDGRESIEFLRALGRRGKIIFSHSQMGIHQQMGLLFYLWIKQVKLVVIDQLDNRLVTSTQLPLR